MKTLQTHRAKLISVQAILLLVDWITWLAARY